MKSGLVPIMDNSAPKYPRPIKTLERIPNRREQDYFYPYKNAEFQQIPWYQQLFNFISRSLYFMTGPKFVVPILGIVLEKENSRLRSRDRTKRYTDVKLVQKLCTCASSTLGHDLVDLWLGKIPSFRHFVCVQ